MLNTYKQIEYEYYESFWKNRNGTFSTDTRHYSSNVPFAGVVDFIVWLRDRGGVSGTVLDVGVGNGRNAVILAQAGFAVTGIDISPSAIALARHNATLHKADYEVAVEDFLSLKQNQQSYDIVVDCGLFHHLRKQQWSAYIQSIQQIIAPGGYFFLKAFSTDSRYLHERTKRNWTSYEQHFNRFFTKQEVLDIFSKDFVCEKVYASDKLDSSITYWVFYFKHKKIPN